MSSDHIRRALEEGDADEILSLTYNNKVTITGSEMDDITELARKHNLGMNYDVIDRILLRDVHLLVYGRRADMLGFYIDYSNLFGEPENIT